MLCVARMHAPRFSTVALHGLCALAVLWGGCENLEPGDPATQPGGAAGGTRGTSGAGPAGMVSAGGGAASGNAAGAVGGSLGGTPAGAPHAGGNVVITPGEPVVQGQALPDGEAFAALAARVADVEKLDAAGLRAAYPATFRGALSYDPTSAQFLDRIQASALALSEPERAALARNGFVVSARQEFPTFLKGLAGIYAEHLPVYVSADALLEAVHSSYDEILLQFEARSLVPELDALLRGMRTRLASADGEAEALAGADLYLAVALGLLDGSVPAPVRGADQGQIRTLIDAANAAAGGEYEMTLFGVKRLEDFSQFKPRGHYTDEPTLQRYFRAQMWLGRIDFRILETLPDGKQVFHRAQYLGMLLMHALVQPDLARFKLIDDTIRTFVGESDYMVVSDVDRLIADLGGPAQARAASAQQVTDAFVRGDYCKQQIASHLMVNDGTVKTLPLNRSFALLGQRYVVDSHVLSDVVFDRVDDRMMPSALDAAFAALGNAQALALHPELATFEELPGALGRMRVLVDAHDDTFWGANFYNLWLSALRALSPAPDMTAAALQGLPEVHRTEAWGRRLLNAQLGSWSELRHDTLLYAKQSYTGIPGCDFPDAYVDPYPAFYAALRKYAEAGSRLVTLANDSKLSMEVARYFETLANASTILGEMAQRELRGEPFSEAQLAFINDAVRIERQSVVCSTIDVPDGWYADLFFNREKSLEFDPTIADVHTQPADEVGNPVGKVLHVGTGYPRLLVATVDTCQGPRAYAGVVYAYHEQITQDFERLTDQEWARRFSPPATRPADVPWLSSVLAK